MSLVCLFFVLQMCIAMQHSTVYSVGLPRELATLQALTVHRSTHWIPPVSFLDT